MAQDVSDLAASLGVQYGCATLGHSYGAFVVLQHAVDYPGEPRGTIVSSGMAAARWLAGVDQQLAAFEPVELRAQVTSSWAAERQVQTEEEAAALLEDQLPFHFLEPRGGALQEYLRRTAGLARYAPEVIRHFASQDYGGSTSKTGSVRRGTRCWCWPDATTGCARPAPPQTWPGGCRTPNLWCSRIPRT